MRLYFISKDSPRPYSLLQSLRLLSMWNNENIDVPGAYAYVSIRYNRTLSGTPRNQQEIRHVRFVLTKSTAIDTPENVKRLWSSEGRKENPRRLELKLIRVQEAWNGHAVQHGTLSDLIDITSNLIYIASQISTLISTDLQLTSSSERWPSSTSSWYHGAVSSNITWRYHSYDNRSTRSWRRFLDALPVSPRVLNFQIQFRPGVALRSARLGPKWLRECKQRKAAWGRTHITMGYRLGTAMRS